MSSFQASNFRMGNTIDFEHIHELMVVVLFVHKIQAVGVLFSWVKLWLKSQRFAPVYLNEDAF